MHVPLVVVVVLLMGGHGSGPKKQHDGPTRREKKAAREAAAAAEKKRKRDDVLHRDEREAAATAKSEQELQHAIQTHGADNPTVQVWKSYASRPIAHGPRRSVDASRRWSTRQRRLKLQRRQLQLRSPSRAALNPSLPRLLRSDFCSVLVALAAVCERCVYNCCHGGTAAYVVTVPCGW